MRSRVVSGAVTALLGTLGWVLCSVLLLACSRTSLFADPAVDDDDGTFIDPIRNGAGTGAGTGGGAGAGAGTIAIPGGQGGAGGCDGIVDACGVCNGFEQDRDCAGICFGNTQVDCAGTCGGTAQFDCDGVCNGRARRDCNGVCNGSAQRDCAGNCNGFAQRDCAGTCNGFAQRDCAGTCNGWAEYDCQGICGGWADYDCAGVCGGSATFDCEGVCNGTAVEDVCGICNGHTEPDCTGACGGLAVVDECGVCNGYNADKDCSGVCFGTDMDGCSWWPTLQHNNQRTGFNRNESGVPPLTPGWSVTLSGSAPLHPVVIEDDRVFVTADTSYSTSTVHALALDTGEELWSYAIVDAGTVGHPSVHDGRVYVQQRAGFSTPTRLWAFDADSGLVAWQAPFGSQTEHYWSPLVTQDSVFINGGVYGGLYGFRSADGEQLWFNDALEQYDRWAAAEYDGLIYSFVAGAVRGHRPDTGEVTKLFGADGSWNGSSMSTVPAFSNGHAFVIASPALYAIDLTFGEQWWAADGYTGVPAVVDGVVLGIVNGWLVARDATTSAVLWTFAGDQALSSAPVAAAGYVYISSDVNTFAIELDTGMQVWTTAHAGWLSIAAHRLFIAATDGHLYTYELSTPD